MLRVWTYSFKRFKASFSFSASNFGLSKHQVVLSIQMNKSEIHYHWISKGESKVLWTVFLFWYFEPAIDFFLSASLKTDAAFLFEVSIMQIDEEAIRNSRGELISWWIPNGDSDWCRSHVIISTNRNFQSSFFIVDLIIVINFRGNELLFINRSSPGVHDDRSNKYLRIWICRKIEAERTLNGKMKRR